MLRISHEEFEISPIYGSPARGLAAVHTHQSGCQPAPKSCKVDARAKRARPVSRSKSLDFERSYASAAFFSEVASFFSDLSDFSDLSLEPESPSFDSPLRLLPRP